MIAHRKTPGGIVKIRLLLALVGLAIGFSLPASAQQKDAVDPKREQQIRALMTKWDDAFNRSDSGGLGALYTDDAVKVTVHGTFRGREAIAKDFAEHDFGRYQSKNYVRKVDRIIAVGNDVRVTGKWKCAFHDTDGKDKHIDGHYSWILVRRGDSWKIGMDTVDEGIGY
jgi:uncharacterized protein (TIGR02246 family)